MELGGVKFDYGRILIESGGVGFDYGIIDIELDYGKVNPRLGDGIGYFRSMNGSSGNRLGLILNKNKITTISNDNLSYYLWSTASTTSGNSWTNEFTMEYCILDWIKIE